MKRSATDIATLILKQISGQISQEERDDLESWKNASEANRKEYESLLKLSVLQQELRQYREAQAVGEKLESPNFKTVEEVASKDARPAKRVVFLRRWYWAAASVIILLGLGLGFYFYTTHSTQQPAVTINVPKDIPAPVSNKAMITLADGSQVFLDSVGNGPLAQQGNIKLVKLANGQIAYQTASGEILKELQYNTLTNPRGSKVIDMELSDGSHVWLNAGSSITYPVAFVGDERKVELKGEGYFEVAKDPSKKFIVMANETETEVLGTHFNINAYDDEPNVKVTLLEGSVKVNNGAGSVTIRPGQQARLTGNQQPVTGNPDLDQVMAWKNGIFQMDNIDVATLMRQVARWYDIDVVYESGIPEGRMTGEVPMTTSLASVLKMFEYSGLKFRIEGKKLTVLK